MADTDARPVVFHPQRRRVLQGPFGFVFDIVERRGA